MLRSWEEGIRERELAEKRRVAPGWLDREEKILEPARIASPSAAGRESARPDLMTDDLMDDVQQTAKLGESRGVSNVDKSSEGDELDRAFGGMDIR